MVVTGYNPCPDEKGTESELLDKQLKFLNQVTILAPMKRGLKAVLYNSEEILNFVTILAPMKRGLKEMTEGGLGMSNIRYNPCPDEKGTERDGHVTR